MAEALTIDIVLQSEQAQRAIEQFTLAMEEAGFAAERTPKEGKKVEQE